MEKLIYDFNHYKSYLKYKTEEVPGNWGIKGRLAIHMGCQGTYLSQVLKDMAELSLEQIFRASDFFDLSEDERKYFILLHQKDRAGTKEVKQYFQSEIDSIKERRLNLTKRLGAQNTLSEHDRGIYYSSWLYMAVHFAVGLEHLQTREELKKQFRINATKLNAIVDFLIHVGLIVEEKNRLKMGANFIRLGNDSPWISKHHANWRNRAINNFDQEDIYDLHYSGVYTLSQEDVLKIKNLYLDSIKKNLEIVKDSKEERMYVLNIDFFNLLK